jgi:isoprenylcysteine carboxyl methyltransferase (ICMT) family protein YpbQ
VDNLLSELPVLFVLIGTTLLHFGERRVHGYNYDFLRFAEGEELIPRQMNKYYVGVAVLPWICLVSSRLTPANFLFETDPIVALCLVLAGCLLRLWSIRSLGRLWSQRCVFVAGMPRVKRGPYRFLKHPEYLARALEGIGYVLFFGANPASALLWLYNQSLLPGIIKTETRQLQELSVAPLHLQHSSSRVGSLNS